MSDPAVPNPHIFRTYDVRGVADGDVTVGTAEVIGRAFGTFIRRQGGLRLVVGRDNRLTSPSLLRALTKGLLNSGCQVIDIGMATSPLLYFAAIHWGLDGGVNVTASHLPREYNGFKLVAKSGAPLSPEDILRIKDLALRRDFEIGEGTLETRDPEPAYSMRFHTLCSPRRPLHVVVDTGNGVAGLFAPKRLREFGCQVTELYCELDGTFPNHVPNPEIEASVEDLQKKVLEVHADLGLAFDCDGDRLGVVSEMGEKYDGDLITALLARDFLTRHPGAQVIVDAKSSMNAVDDIRKHGGVPVVWKTGHALIRKRMAEEGILLGGELSGHIFVTEGYYTIDDALYVACRLVQILAASDQPISGHFSGMPKLYTGIAILDCPDSEKSTVVNRVRRYLEERYIVNSTDGVRVEFRDGWGIVRASNTTSSISVRCEATSPKRLEQIRSVMMAALKECALSDLKASR
jgi:phosphomannomutase/phosphoglucomutase